MTGIHYIDGLMQTRHKMKKVRETIIGGLGATGASMLTEKDANSSQSYFQNKLKKNPGDIDALYGLAVSQSRLGQRSESINTFLYALKLAPEDIDLLRSTGINYFGTGQLVQAVEYLRKAYAVNGRDPGDSALSRTLL